MRGALLACYEGAEFERVEALLSQTLGRLGMITWNDAPERKYEEVKALVDELDI